MRALLVVRFTLFICCAVGASARAATFYVTVAGLGGEPDYEQRFTANANDLDKVFKALPLPPPSALSRVTARW